MATDRTVRFRLLRRITVFLSVVSAALAGILYLQVAGVLSAAAAVASDATSAGQPTSPGGGDPGLQPPQQQPGVGTGNPVGVTGGS